MEASNFISDNCKSVNYADFNSYFRILDNHPELGKLSPDSVVHFYFANNTVSALVFLYLITKEINIFLSKDDDDIKVPGFCSHKLKIADDEENEINKALFADIIHFKKIDETKRFGSTNNIIFETSGSTGKSKFVVVKKEDLLNNAKNFLKRITITEKDRVFITVPCYHMYGLGAAFLPAYLAGATIRLLNKNNVIKYIETDKAFNPTIVYHVPTMIKQITKIYKSSNKYRLSVVAGDKIDAENFSNYESKFGTLVNLYGSTELGAIATSLPEDPVEIRADGFLKFLPGVKYRLNTVQEGASILEINHPFRFSCYINSNGEILTNDGERVTAMTEWYNSNDLCKIDTSGYFKILGRFNNSVNRNGKLISISEIESIIDQGVNEIEKCLVTQVSENTIRGNKLILYYLPKMEFMEKDIDIRKACFNIMEKDFVPDVAVKIKKIPVLDNGKIDRVSLQNLYKNEGKNNS